MPITSISLTIGFACPECGHKWSEDFLAFSEVKYSDCDETFSWADVLTDDEHKAVDAAARELEAILEAIDER
ncbi:MAG: hypothetical protein H6636_06865 [Anaerolineales bacterium]|nr:hypothetical protein [Anaerolineales bacterium]